MNLASVRQTMPVVNRERMLNQNGVGILHKRNVAEYAIKHGNVKARDKYKISRYTLDSYMAEYKKGVY